MDQKAAVLTKILDELTAYNSDKRVAKLQQEIRKILSDYEMGVSIDSWNVDAACGILEILKAKEHNKG